jgi:DNA mismatch repair ATPase MutS
LSREKKEDQDRLIQWLSIDSLFLGNKIMQSVMYVLPALSLIALLYWILNGLATPFIVIGLMQWSFIGFFSKRITLFQNYVGDKRFLLETFASHLDLIRKETFQSSLLSDARANSEEACREIRVLAKRVRALDLRLNIFASLLLNTTLLFDLWSVLRLEQWRERNREHLPLWLDAIATMDALNSAGNFAYNHPTFSFPSINESLSLEGEDVGHPLLDEGVTNTISFSEKTNVWIVTGANMAGKSTFLRTVGINTVLAMCGMPVCATRFQCPIVEVYSGMRNTDSITDHQSYFLAELLRLQSIMNQFRQGKRLLVLLDEILKGTNSVDKLTGSQELIRQLVHVDGLCLVATHDVALGEMAAAFPAIQNYHFETFINGEELAFDYKLKPGVSTGKNATFLMKKMGIIA